MRREVAEAELAAWVAARARGRAADEVLHYLQRGGRARRTATLALHALAQTGERRRSREGPGRPGGRRARARGPQTGPLAIRAPDVMHFGRSFG